MSVDVQDELGCAIVEPTREVPGLVDDVLNGLFTQNKHLPPKYFYDDRGSALFDQICDEPEYYPTRTEDALLSASAKSIIANTMPRQILEFGSGTSRKTVHLLKACEEQQCEATYIPFDVCDDVIIKSAAGLQKRFPWLQVEPISGDYNAGLGNLPTGEGPNLFLFLGGTIGNFAEVEAVQFLREVRGLMSAGDHLLIGADRVKEPAQLHAAYNDAAGITAEFNLNLLEVLNRELDASFNKSNFAHYACYNPDESQIEMYLMSMEAQAVEARELGRNIYFDEGEAILTEISRKFTKQSLEALLADAGFVIQAHYEATENPFSLALVSAD
ncbi:MAG: L-histidine N(alpha)-methyltransferase [Gammaproteobacteria bacterium]